MKLLEDVNGRPCYAAATVGVAPSDGEACVECHDWAFARLADAYCGRLPLDWPGVDLYRSAAVAGGWLALRHIRSRVGSPPVRVTITRIYVTPGETTPDQLAYAVCCATWWEMGVEGDSPAELLQDTDGWPGGAAPPRCTLGPADA